jgi:flagellar protein FliO/FliZ
MRLTKHLIALFGFTLYSTISFAQQSTKPVIGSQVSTDMNAFSMIMSLLMVLAAIVISALILKRFNLVQTGTKDLKIVTSLALGNKEKLMVVQVGEQQMLIGVTTQQINLLQTLDKPIKVVDNSTQVPNTALVNFFKKNLNTPSSNKHVE